MLRKPCIVAAPHREGPRLPGGKGGDSDTTAALPPNLLCLCHDCGSPEISHWLCGLSCSAAEFGMTAKTHLNPEACTACNTNVGCCLKCRPFLLETIPDNKERPHLQVTSVKYDDGKHFERLIIPAPNTNEPSSSVYATWMNPEHRVDLGPPVWCTNESKILVIGDGDFSWSAALARRLGTARKLVVTTLEVREKVLRKYHSTNLHRNWLLRHGAILGYEIDATRPHRWNDCRELSKLGVPGIYDIIIWNFPHNTVDNSSDHAPESNRRMLKDFLHTIPCLLNDKGLVLLTVKCGGHYDKWDINDILCTNPALNKFSSIKFVKAEWPGYSHKHTNRDLSAQCVRSYTHLLRFDESKEHPNANYAMLRRGHQIEITREALYSINERWELRFRQIGTDSIAARQQAKLDVTKLREKKLVINALPSSLLPPLPAQRANPRKRRRVEDEVLCISDAKAAKEAEQRKINKAEEKKNLDMVKGVLGDRQDLREKLWTYLLLERALPLAKNDVHIVQTPPPKKLPKCKGRGAGLLFDTIEAVKKKDMVVLDLDSEEEKPTIPTHHDDEDEDSDSDDDIEEC
eukprot:TRINITY_DN14069_c0_g1_i1.p1 TRINITY_DN14069_c0_g1~~TRINITY_DN14069_c0_g1_i1.p1  ORF type:complete len:574 (+),score=49.35 TRINITY_DN14069_c0_g1_i1:34-1755(+)